MTNFFDGDLYHSENKTLYVRRKFEVLVSSPFVKSEYNPSVVGRFSQRQFAEFSKKEWERLNPDAKVTVKRLRA